jgi:hypothetical protein
MGTLHDAIIHAWSMQDFVDGRENGHDHFFATFGKFGRITGAHRDDMLAEVATRAADENEVYLETMFTLGRNTGSLMDTLSSGSIAAVDRRGESGLGRGQLHFDLQLQSAHGDAGLSAHAERIGHGVDINTETDPAGLLVEMAAQNILVEICLSSNTQILAISGLDRDDRVGRHA